MPDAIIRIHPERIISLALAPEDCELEPHPVRMQSREVTPHVSTRHRS
jgi:hypothetical protein